MSIARLPACVFEFIVTCCKIDVASSCLQSCPHRFERLGVVHLIAATVRQMNSEQHQ